MKHFSIGKLEFGLILIVFYLSFWVWNGFLALYVSVCFSGVSFFGWLVGALAEWVEPSRVRKRELFGWYWVSILTPIFVAMLAIYVLKIDTLPKVK